MALRRILLVEDSSTMRRMLSTMLREDRFEVDTANDGLQGLAKARVEPRPDLILTDYEMPELDGAGLCEAIKADKELRAIPVLMLTSLGEAQNKITGLTAGADDYIEKPKGQDEFRVLCAASTLICGSPTCAVSWPSATACWKRPTKNSRSSSTWLGKSSLLSCRVPPSRGGCYELACPVRAGQSVGRRRVRYLPARQQSPGNSGGRRVGPWR